MTTFEDGPAAGETLMLRRSPLFLRVVTDPRHDNRIDALDQLDDKPEEFENLTAYVRIGKAGYAFIDFSGKAKSASGLYPIAKYSVALEQPAEFVMRDNDKWRWWCRLQVQRTHAVA